MSNTRQRSKRTIHIAHAGSKKMLDSLRAQMEAQRLEFGEAMDKLKAESLTPREKMICKWSLQMGGKDAVEPIRPITLEEISTIVEKLS